MEMLSSFSTLYYTQSYHICGIVCTLSHMLSYIAMGCGGLRRGPPVMNISESSVMLDNRADTQIHTADDGYGYNNVNISAIGMVMALTIAQLM